MNEKELNNEKKELINFLLEKINSIEDTDVLEKIKSKTIKLNDILDYSDSKLKNLIDDLLRLVTLNEKNKLKKIIEDIFDKYDKKQKNGEYYYSNEDRIKIRNYIEEVNKLCDQNFWDRFFKILGIGS